MKPATFQARVRSRFMSETKNAADAAKKSGITLQSKLGLKLEVVGTGDPVGTHGNVETVRVRRLADQGVRDIPRGELELINGKQKVAAALERVAKPTPPPAELNTLQNPPAE